MSLDHDKVQAIFNEARELLEESRENTLRTYVFEEPCGVKWRTPAARLPLYKHLRYVCVWYAVLFDSFLRM